jgi:exopolyphosphatase/guanosine-5'-triphosphate,3'-diphosphate pyrophosphatase
VRRACIDIGSNTTRLLVAECDADQLLEVHQERAFTRIGRGLLQDGSIGPAKIAEVAETVARQHRLAVELGSEHVYAVATAAIRHAANGMALAAAVEAASGLAVRILTGEEEARLAFVGAARTLERTPAGTLGVVDVGGGSSELVVGTAPDRVTWWTSFGLGSGDLADQHLHSDPPSSAELSELRGAVARELEGLSTPRPGEAVAVGGSAASLRRLAGPTLDADAFERVLKLLAAEPRSEIARRFALDRERVRLLPAGLVILQAASELFGAALEIGRGGIREGVLLEASE